MKNEFLDKTLAQIVNEDHKAAKVFEKYGLDFCCKGKRSLQMACADKDLPVETIAEELDLAIGKNESPVVDYNKLPLSTLSDFIVNTHHDYTKKELPQIFHYLQKVSSKHGDRHNELHQIFEKFSELKDELEMHMRKEEYILFPRIKELESATYAPASRINIQAPVAVMEDEHEHEIGRAHV